MDTSINLKRRRDSGNSTTEEEKKNKKKTLFFPAIKRNNPIHKHLPSHHLWRKKPNDHLKSYHYHSKKYQHIETPSPQHCPLSSQAVLPSHSVTRTQSPIPKTHPRAKSVVTDNRQALNTFYFCVDCMDSPTIDHQIKKTFAPH